MTRLGVVLVAVLVSSCSAPSQPGQDVLRLRSLGAPVEASIGPEGGTLAVEAGGRQLRLEVPPTALLQATTLSLEPVEVEGLEGAPAVRFGPAGLTFALPATLVVTPPPGDRLVGLHFEEGELTGALLGAAPHDDGRSVLIAHFSGAVIATPEQLRERLTAEDRALVENLADALDDEALGLAERLELLIEPAVANGGGSVLKLKTAAALLSSWSAAVQLLQLSNEPTLLRGSETFEGANARLRAVVLGHAEALLPAFEQPACSDPASEVKTPADWLRRRKDVLGVILLFGGDPDFGTPCTHGELVLTGPQALTDTDAEVALDARFELVGPTGVRELSGPLTFTFVTEGATGPTSERSETGSLTGLRFARPAAPRAPAVRITADVDLFMHEFSNLEVAPVVRVASEPLAAMATATPATIGPGGTSTLCVQAFASGQPVAAFDASFTALGTGTLNARQVTALSGEACVTYTALANAQAAMVPITVEVDVNGARATAMTTLTQTASSVQVAVTGPSSTLAIGASMTLTATVTGASNPAVTWTATGGTITASGVFTASSGGAQVITATSVEDPSVSATFSVTVTCDFPNPVVTNDSRQTLSSAAFVHITDNGVTVANEQDFGTSSASASFSYNSLTYSSGATASAGRITARGTSPATPMTISANAQGTAEAVSRIATVGATATCRVRVTASLDGSVDSDGSLNARLEFDPYDDVGSRSTVFTLAPTTGAQSFMRTLTVDTTFSCPRAARVLYAGLYANLTGGGTVTMAITSASVAVVATGCN